MQPETVKDLLNRAARRPVPQAEPVTGGGRRGGVALDPAGLLGIPADVLVAIGDLAESLFVGLTHFHGHTGGE